MPVGGIGSAVASRRANPQASAAIEEAGITPSSNSAVTGGSAPSLSMNPGKKTALMKERSCGPKTKIMRTLKGKGHSRKQAAFLAERILSGKVKKLAKKRPPLKIRMAGVGKRPVRRMGELIARGRIPEAIYDTADDYIDRIRLPKGLGGAPINRGTRQLLMGAIRTLRRFKGKLLGQALKLEDSMDLTKYLVEDDLEKAGSVPQFSRKIASAGVKAASGMSRRGKILSFLGALAALHAGGRLASSYSKKKKWISDRRHYPIERGARALEWIDPRRAGPVGTAYDRGVEALTDRAVGYKWRESRPKWEKAMYEDELNKAEMLAIADDLLKYADALEAGEVPLQKIGPVLGGVLGQLAGAWAPAAGAAMRGTARFGYRGAKAGGIKGALRGAARGAKAGGKSWFRGFARAADEAEVARGVSRIAGESPAAIQMAGVRAKLRNPQRRANALGSLVGAAGGVAYGIRSKRKKRAAQAQKSDNALDLKKLASRIATLPERERSLAMVKFARDHARVTGGIPQELRK